MRRSFPRFAAAFLVFALAAPAALADGRTVAGTIVRLDAAEGAFTLQDSAGVSWRYKAAPDAGIDLAAFRVGDRVTVTIGRATPLNMGTAGDLLKKGDRVEKSVY